MNTCDECFNPIGCTKDRGCRLDSLDGPEFSDCATAAHLRSCGFCRAVRSPDVDRLVAVMDELMRPGHVFELSRPYRIWHGLPVEERVVPKAPPLPKPSRRVPFIWIRRG